MMFAGPADAQLFSENFEGLTLDPFVSVGESGGDGTDWTDIPPAGWSRDNTTTPVGGPIEFFGFTYLDKNSWIATAGNQDRDDFTKGAGTVMVADPDEYDDDAGAGNVLGETQAFNVFMQTPAISLTGVAPGSVVLSFDSSFVPYESMTGLVDVSFNGGTSFSNLLTLDTASTPGGNSSLARANETVVLPLNNPAGASNVIVRFGMVTADNDWWWAIDNVRVQLGQPALNLEVNRDTGEILLKNNTANAVNIAGYSITSEAGALSFENWNPIAGRLDDAGDGTIDSDGDWTVLTLPNQNDNLSEASLDAADDASGGTIALGATIDLTDQGVGPTAGGWLKSPVEDLVFRYISGGQVVDGIVNFVGNGGMAHQRGDFDADGDIDAGDWVISRSNQRADMSSLSPTEAYLLGDLTGDQQNNHADFVAFKEIFDAQNGSGSFAAMLHDSATNVPEPGTTSLIVFGGAMLAWGLRRQS
jgi:hypothetical protein